jgi:hypothetical protein
MLRGIFQRIVTKTINSRPPDFIVGPKDNPYLYRWWFIPRNKWLNIYVHEFKRSDDDFALHDHPWANLSILVEGRYIEHTIADGGIHHRTERVAGEMKLRKATAAHRIELIEGQRVRTIFVTGPYQRKWGFHCPKGWRPWTHFVQQREGGNEVGAGCGELA